MRFEGVAGALSGEILEQRFFGRRRVRISAEPSGSVRDPDALIDAIGHVPLPPYIKREDLDADRDRYQTVYARDRGSVAAPTAGLHFTAELLEAIAARGVDRISITLHVGYGTFKPVRVESVEDHAVDPEPYEISPAAAAAVGRARAEGRRVIAVGTTTTRALEDAAGRNDGIVRAGRARGLALHPSRPHLPRRRRPDDELPPAAVIVADARRGVRRPGTRPRGVCRGRAAAVSLLQLRGCDGYSLKASSFRGLTARGHLRALIAARFARGWLAATAASGRSPDRRPPSPLSLIPDAHFHILCAVPFTYDDFDLSGVATYPLASRKSKAHASDFAKAYQPGSGVAALVASLPTMLAGGGLQGGRRRGPGGARVERRDAVGPRRARDQDGPRARAHRSDGARIRLGDRDEWRGDHPRLRGRPVGCDVRRSGGRARARPLRHGRGDGHAAECGDQPGRCGGQGDWTGGRGTPAASCRRGTRRSVSSRRRRASVSR